MTQFPPGAWDIEGLDEVVVWVNACRGSPSKVLRKMAPALSELVTRLLEMCEAPEESEEEADPIATDDQPPDEDAPDADDDKVVGDQESVQYVENPYSVRRF